jgi:hypothetical protein
MVGYDPTDAEHALSFVFHEMLGSMPDFKTMDVDMPEVIAPGTWKGYLFDRDGDEYTVVITKTPKVGE